VYVRVFHCEYSMDKKCFKHKPLSDCCCIYYSQKNYGHKANWSVQPPRAASTPRLPTPRVKQQTGFYCVQTCVFLSFNLCTYNNYTHACIHTCI